MSEQQLSEKLDEKISAFLTEKNVGDLVVGDVIDTEEEGAMI